MSDNENERPDIPATPPKLSAADIDMIVSVDPIYRRTRLAERSEAAAVLALKRAVALSIVPEVVTLVGRFLGTFADAFGLSPDDVVKRICVHMDLDGDDKTALLAAMAPLPEVEVVDAARSALEWWCEPGLLYELRAIGRVGSDKPATTAAFFDNLDTAAKLAAELSGTWKGVYATLNPVDRSRLDRSPNALFRPRLGDLTSADDVVRRRWLLVDCDPVRPADHRGQSTTIEEKQAAFLRAIDVWRWLWKRGWPHPVVADSGNGVHLRYRVDLPANDETVGAVLDVLAEKFSDNVVDVDTIVRDPNRICKLYGTLACKGVSTPERPHRQSGVIYVPR